MLPRTTMVMRQFPFSVSQPGITYLAVHPISWAEPTILERRLRPPVTPDAAMEVVNEFAKPDFAINFETYWDLWAPNESGDAWISQPVKANFIVHGTEFDENSYEERGHLEIDFGLDSPFLHDELDLTPAEQDKVRDNVAKLVDFTQRVEKNSNLSGRVLWSESEENLAQKLISRLQRVH